MIVGDTVEWVDDDTTMAGIVDELVGQPRYAIDTEFHREQTYFPRLALVQLGWPGGTALVDPLAVSASLLARLFASDAIAVLHAAQQDLDVLTHAVGAVPRRMYDTQIAASFVGYSTPSLVALVQGELGASPAKGDRLTDWLRRPLSDNQKEYAAADVRYLLELQDRLDERLGELGRCSWVADACEELRTRPTGATAPEDAWARLKDARTLRGGARAIAQALASWRELEARRLDIPVRQVLPDLAILAISQRAPSSPEELAQCRGVDQRHRRGRLVSEILDAVETGRHRPAPPVVGGGEDVDRSLRPAVTLISAWVSQVAKDEHIDTSMLATRQDLVALLTNDPAARLRCGWRGELLGTGITGLLEGTAALTFSKDGLQLIDVPH